LPPNSTLFPIKTPARFQAQGVFFGRDEQSRGLIVTNARRVPVWAEPPGF